MSFERYTRAERCIGGIGCYVGCEIEGKERETQI